MATIAKTNEVNPKAKFRMPAKSLMPLQSTERSNTMMPVRTPTTQKRWIFRFDCIGEFIASRPMVKRP